MPYSIDGKLVVAVSSSAVFDMKAADDVFRSHGELAYRKHQLENIDVPFGRGVAFSFIRRLLNLNVLHSDEQPIEVIVLSRNDPDSGRRFFRSCQHYGLSITRGAFLTGKPPYKYVPAFNACLFLSANSQDVRGAIADGLPAGLVLPTASEDEDGDMELRVAFDFDGVLADDEAEKIFHDTKDISKFHQAEQNKVSTPHNPGPLKELIIKLAHFQKLEMAKAASLPGYSSALRVAIITARDAPANERLVTTLTAWGLNAVETFFMGGIEKRRVLEIFRPHMFFDDQLLHLEPSAESVPSVHIPFGVRNAQ